MSPLLYKLADCGVCGAVHVYDLETSVACTSDWGEGEASTNRRRTKGWLGPGHATATACGKVLKRLFSPATTV
ncbi:hypothetical protein HPB50_025018 [Hyalomma asiaticum]|uniref:Uncharacterized protein n=1 Tax=Hyalomma asiaticum TaxID=266040 RepID=A0ACB7S651_HYAAI|nr:hypothetical protein HPB50_025018 [Hyalomma asiaticum]